MVYLRRYYFVSPNDAGTTLARLFERPNDLRSGLLKNWDAYCLNDVRSCETPLTKDLSVHIAAYDFQTITFHPVLKVIEEHQTTRWHVHRFGGAKGPKLAASFWCSVMSWGQVVRCVGRGEYSYAMARSFAGAQDDIFVLGVP